MTSCLLIALALAAAPGEPITLDTQKQLFLDDYVVGSCRNLSRQIHPALKFAGNPVLRPTEPWEGDATILYGSVIADGQKCRMWYTAAGNVAYAESTNGTDWKKPALGVVTLDGRDTNLVIRANAPPDSPGAIPYFHEAFGAFRDDRDPDPGRRYKLGFLSIQRNYSGPNADLFHSNQRRGLGVAVSADGIHWRLYENWATEATIDGATHWMFDPKRQKYVLYGRTKFALPEVQAAVADKPWTHFWGRSVIRAESPDFLRWDQSKPGSGELVLTADAKDPVGSEIYSMMVFPYEGIYIGLVQMFQKRRDTCWLEIQLAVSRDTVHFSRVGNREAFIPVGPEGSWDRFNNSIAMGPPLVRDDRLWFYYGGRTYRHSPFNGPEYPYHGKDRGKHWGAIGVASITRDRFVSMTASSDEGELVTKPVRLTGDVLHLNAAAGGGEIVVEMLDGKGAVVARSKPIHQDGWDIPVAWEGKAPKDLQSPVTLRFRIREAKLFALWCQ